MILKTTKNHSQKIGSAFFVEAKKNDFMKDIGAKRKDGLNLGVKNQAETKNEWYSKKYPQKLGN